MVMKSGPAPVAAMRAAGVSQNPRSPTADLTPTGRPVAPAIRSTNSISRRRRRTRCARTARAVAEGGHPADACDLLGDLRRRQQPAEAGLGAPGELDLDRPHRRLAEAREQAFERAADAAARPASIRGTSSPYSGPGRSA